jgi:hypothetical protein
MTRQDLIEAIVESKFSNDLLRARRRLLADLSGRWEVQDAAGVPTHETNWKISHLKHKIRVSKARYISPDNPYGDDDASYKYPGGNY